MDKMQRESDIIANLNARLKEILLEYLPSPGIRPTAIKGLHLVRSEDVNQPERCFEKPLAGLVVQGTKHSFMCGHEYIYTANQSIVAGVDMPITSYVVNPTPEKPFLFIYLYLDKEILSSLAIEMKGSLPFSGNPDCSAAVGGADRDIMEMFLRLLELDKKTEQIPMRAPMMLRELHYLLLIGQHGRLLRQLHTAGTQNNQVVHAINWIRENFCSPMRVETLARQVGMSVASLHRHFKAFTGLSPLQYQKQLRLYEAQRLMLVENERASMAALAVGYESVAQFNREYKKVFGEPPFRDMNRRRSGRE